MLCGLMVRHGQHHHIRRLEVSGALVFEVGATPQIRVRERDWITRIGPRRDLRDLKVRVLQGKAQEFATCVTRTTNDSDR
jgi:hypothetical protein